jgi:hypothetical protein
MRLVEEAQTSKSRFEYHRPAADSGSAGPARQGGSGRRTLTVVTRKELEWKTLIPGKLKALIEASRNPCVSIYMPTHRVYGEVQQDPIRLKTLLQQAEEGLIAMGLRRWQAEELLKPAAQLVPERPFWLQGGDGLALFRSPDLFDAYHLPMRFEELAVVSDRFHVKPLIALLGGERFYILALSQNEVRLLYGTRHSIQELTLPEGTSKSLAEMPGQEDHVKQHQIFASGRPGSRGRGAVQHGYVTGEEDTRTDLLNYFHRIDSGLQPLLRDERVPLVVAGVEYLFPVYREANTYRHLIDQTLPGNPEGVRPEELRDRAVRLLEPYFLEAQRAAAERYRQLLGTGLASSNLTEVVPSAYLGRVDSLFVAVGVQQWGSHDPSTHTVQLHDAAEPGDDDLLDLAAVQTLLHGGAVYAVGAEDVPDDAPVAALFRY